MSAKLTTWTERSGFRCLVYIYTELALEWLPVYQHFVVDFHLRGHGFHKWYGIVAQADVLRPCVVQSLWVCRLGAADDVLDGLRIARVGLSGAVHCFKDAHNG